MDSILSLQRQTLSSSQDTDFLREQARLRVENLASELWTDFNSHDPGITILEQLAYAITDLGLRASLPIADLLASGEQQSLYTAAEVLPNAALTPNDYRRLLLGFKPVCDDLNAEAVRDVQVVMDTIGDVDGLYALKVLFDGVLNESWIEQAIEVNGPAGESFYARVY